MATLLVNAKMDPALAARIEASVAGRRLRAWKVRSTARVLSLVRLGLLLAGVALVTSILLTRHRERVSLERARARLFEQWTVQSSPIAPSDFEFLPRLERVLADAAGPYPGDLWAEELRSLGALAAILARPAIYVRGSLAAFTTSTGVARAAMESGKDGLLICLHRPPEGTAEKLLLPTARLALGQGPPVEELTPNVRRLADVTVGLPYLLPQWGERIRHAPDPSELLRLERELKRAPIAAAKAGLSAQILIAALDEPNEAGGVTELDGEHNHRIRVQLVELASGKVLLRFRKLVDPSWITPNRRSQYARELDGCKLALEIHDAARNLAPATTDQPAARQTARNLGPATTAQPAAR